MTNSEYKAMMQKVFLEAKQRRADHYFDGWEDIEHTRFIGPLTEVELERSQMTHQERFEKYVL